MLCGCSEDRHRRDNKGNNGIAVKDDLGYTLRFEKKPVRVISLAPSITEMIYALGTDKSLIGNTLFCTYPADAEKKVKVGDLLTVDYEKILALKPDLILISVEGNARETYEKLKQYGFSVFVTNPRDFQGIKKTCRDLGQIFRSEAIADSSVRQWDERYNNITKKVKAAGRKTGMFLVSLNPIMLAGKNTFINELLTAAGVDNIAIDQPVNYPVFSREEILKRNPEYIITTGNASGDVSQIRSGYSEWRNVEAVRKNKIIMVDADMFLRPGPRFVMALEELYEKLNRGG